MLPTTAATVALATTAAAVLPAPAAAVETAAAVLPATAAAVEPVSVVPIADTVVGALSGQQVLSNDLIRLQMSSSASKRAAAACIPPQSLFPSVGTSASTVIPFGQTEHLSDSGVSVVATGVSVVTTGASVTAASVVAFAASVGSTTLATVVSTEPPQHSSSNPLIRSHMASSALNLAASLWMPPHVFPFSVSVSPSTLIPPGHTMHGSSCARVPVERMAIAAANMGSFISDIMVAMWLKGSCLVA